MKEIVKNIAAEPPIGWKKIRNWALTIGAISGAIIAAPVAIPGIVIPAAILTIANYGALIGIIAGAGAQIPVKKK